MGAGTGLHLGINHCLSLFIARSYRAGCLSLLIARRFHDDRPFLLIARMFRDDSWTLLIARSLCDWTPLMCSSQIGTITIVCPCSSQDVP